MKNRLASLLLFAIMQQGCNNPAPKPVPAPATPVDTVTKAVEPVKAPPPPPDIQKESARLEKYLKRAEIPSQHLKAPARVTTVLKGAQGTLIQIEPTDYVMQDGQPVINDIDVELKEMTNQEQLMRDGAQTISDGKLLVSGGAYYINLTCGGEQLKLKLGHSLKVRLPKITDKDMTLFYGQRDSAGNMNWQPTQQKMAYDPTSRKLINAKNGFGFDGWPISDSGRAISGLKSGPILKDSLIKTLTGKGRDQMVSKRIAKGDRYDTLATNIYNEIALQKLGWINCDHFLEQTNLTNLAYTIDPKDSIICAQVYLAFKDINSIITYEYGFDQHNAFNNIPAGAKATLLAIALKKGRVYASKTELTIEKGHKITLSLKPTPDKDVADLFKFKG